MLYVLRTKSRPASRDHSVAPTSGWIPPSDRRHEPRCRADRRHAVSAQLMGGVDVKLCNVSTRGVMFESSMRVLVGARVTLRLRTATQSVLLPGDVVRCRVSATRHGRLRYETALALASDCPLSNDDLTMTRTKVNTADGEVVEAEVVESVTLFDGW